MRNFHIYQIGKGYSDITKVAGLAEVLEFKCRAYIFPTTAYM